MNITKIISKYNFSPGSIERLNNGYIVIHYVGALGSAKNNCEYYASGNRGVSAHLFVDHNGDIYQSVEFQNIAFHCGAAGGLTYKHPFCRNENSIGIELCCRTTGNVSVADANWYFEDATVSSAIAITKKLMATYGIPADHVIRHHDVTGKICPAPYVYNFGKHTWNQFKDAITKTSEIQNQENFQETDELGWKAIVSAGYPEVVAAAILGNLKAESGLKANNLQNGYEQILGMTDETYTSSVDSGNYSKVCFYSDKAGYGLAQWTYSTRKKMMYEYVVEKMKKSIGDTEAQFAFLLYELSVNFKSLVEELKACSTVKAASDLILTKYEAPADQSERVKNQRASYAQEFYDKFANKQASSGFTPFKVKVDITDLNIRKGPGTDYAKTGKHTGVGVFTIVDVVNGVGSDSGWGLLKSYQEKRDGWISLDFARRIND